MAIAGVTRSLLPLLTMPPNAGCGHAMPCHGLPWCRWHKNRPLMTGRRHLTCDVKIVKALFESAKSKPNQRISRIRLAQQACSNMEDQFSAPAAGTEIECATNLSAWAWNLNSSLKEILRNAATHGNLRCPLDEATFLRGPWDPCYFKCLQACTTCLTPELDR
jgi:hypothetical protein